MRPKDRDHQKPLHVGGRAWGSDDATAVNVAPWNVSGLGLRAAKAPRERASAMTLA
jgi:hypothetical protein